MNKLYIVGLGPGGAQFMTQQARDAMADSAILCGYKVYTDLVTGLYPEKEVMTTGMTKEIDRCRMALEKAAAGTTVSMVCSGDSGVYGMACLIYQLAPEFGPVDIVVVPGVTAALSGGSVLGAPLSHDFCVISLSDLLTPWALIEKRLSCAAMADFCMAIYNPCSHKRKDYLEKACTILMEHKSPETICGFVRNIGREGQEHQVMTLAELKTKELDMFCTVFIGNAKTFVQDGKMITPRGYEAKM